jgi:hypothetical protein
MPSATTIPPDAGVGRRASTARNPTRKVVRRQPAVRHKKTTAEKAETKQRNQETREKIHNALASEQTTLWARAQELRDEHGLHTVKWWHDAIIQQASKPKNVRKMTPWKAFMSKRSKEKNDGAWIMYPFHSCTYICAATI